MNLKGLVGRKKAPYSEHTTPSGGGRGWRLLVGVMSAIAFSYLLASIIWRPTKRNIEVLAGLIFLGIVLAADPFKALLFTQFVLPFPAYTSVGTTNMLLIFAVAGLVMVKAPQLNLGSPFIRRDLDLPIAAFLLFVALSFAKQPEAALVHARFLAIGLLSAVVLYYLTILLLRDEERLWSSIRFAQIMALGLGIMGLLQFVFPEKQVLPEFFAFSRKVASMEEVRRGEVRVTATFNGQELFAEFTALSIMLQYLLLRLSKTLREKTF